jgi:hypothetical protein
VAGKIRQVTGPQHSWNVEEGDYSVDQQMWLKSEDSGLDVLASVYQLQS